MMMDPLQIVGGLGVLEDPSKMPPHSMTKRKLRSEGNFAVAPWWWDSWETWAEITAVPNHRAVWLSESRVSHLPYHLFRVQKRHCTAGRMRPLCAPVLTRV